MQRLRLLAIALLIPFGGLTAYAVYQHGFKGILEYQLQTSAGLQVIVDLVIAMVLVLCWLVPHARRTGRNPWPYIVVTAIAGSFGPLLYLVGASDERAAG